MLKINEEDIYEVTCQHCGNVYLADFEAFDTGNVICPKCHQPFVLDKNILERLGVEDERSES